MENSKCIKEQSSESFACPVCGSIEISMLTQSWKNFHDEKKFYFDEKEWFCECDECGTIFRCPLVRYEDYRKYGEDYYDNVDPGQTVDEHAEAHFEAYQRHNYDSLRKYLNANLPPSSAKRWLDVGAIGYSTTFDEYDFTTIEPDERIVNLGRRLFKKGILTNPLRKNPDIYCNTIDNFKSDKKFDGIVFHNSFYCLPFPCEGLLRAFDLLKENGELLITISTYFCNATYSHTDGALARIEDLLPGTTLWVFHNPHSLEYLCQRAGFSLVAAEEIEAYGHKTMMLFRFRRNSNTAIDKDLLEKSKQLMSEKEALFFDDLAKDTQNSLLEINRGDCFVLGSLHTLSEICRSFSLEALRGFVLFDTPRCQMMSNGVRVLGWDDFIEEIASAPNQFDAAVLSFKFQDEIFGKLQDCSQHIRSILKPNRKSGMETLFIKFRGQDRFCKGLRFDLIGK